MRTQSIRTATLVIPAVLLTLAGCGSDDAVAVGTVPSTSAPTTDAIGPAYKGAAGVAGASAGNDEPAFDSTDYAGAAGLAGAVAGNYKPVFDSTDYRGAAGVVGAAAGKFR